MHSATKSEKPAKKLPIRKRKLHRFDCSESWCIHYGEEQLAMITKHMFGGMLNVYLMGSDEPIMKRFDNWEEAKDYVFDRLNIKRGRRRD